MRGSVRMAVSLVFMCGAGALAAAPGDAPLSGVDLAVAAQFDGPTTTLSGQHPHEVIGTTFEGWIEISGAEFVGGGVLEDPVGASWYRWDDGRFLVLVEWSLPRKTNESPPVGLITDAFLVDPVPAGWEFVFQCEGQGADAFSSIVAVARYDPDREMLTEIRDAWMVDHFTGRAVAIAPTGISCVNMGYGL